ncbi:MAG: glycosyltransferase [bacterium]|nr:glycosyltransferase [bacterium]
MLSLERRAPAFARAYSIALISLHADPATVVGSPQNGGVTIYVRELARALAQFGHRVDVFTRRTDPQAPASERRDGYTLHRIAAGPPAHLGNDEIAAHLDEALAALDEAFDRHAYDLISSHYWLSGTLGDALARRRGIAHVHTLHSHGTARKRRDAITLERIEIERKLLQTTPIVTLSPSHRELFARDYGLVPPRLAVVPAGVDLARFRPGDVAETRRALGVPERGRYVGYVGRLTREKGIDELISAFALLRANGTEAGLLVVGGAQRGSRVPELRALAARFGVAEHVHFLGAIPNARVADAFRAADVVAVPSHYEAFGLVALEARACGVPVVASDVGGLRDLVTPASGGARVAPGDLAGWARELGAALEPGELQRRRARVLHEGVGPYSWTSIASRIVAFGLHDVCAD